MVFYTVHTSLGFELLIEKNIERFEGQTILFSHLKRGTIAILNYFFRLTS